MRTMLQVPHPRAGFTMVEIALSIAIVALAMVALIGVLPSGLQVQRDNREETIVHQDGTYLLEVLQGSAGGLDDLVNHVEEITRISHNAATDRTTRLVAVHPSRANPANPPPDLILDDARTILGLLSTPAIYESPDGDDAFPVWIRSRTRVLMRSISGNASSRPQSSVPQPDPAFRETAFTYMLTPTILPANQVMPASGNPFGNLRKGALDNPLHQIRLHFAWPVTEIGQGEDRYRIGNKEKVFTALVSGRLVRTTTPEGVDLFRFESLRFAPSLQPGENR